MRRPLLALVVLVLLTGCASVAPQPKASVPSVSPTPAAEARPPVEAKPFNQELHDELIGMLERDQSERTGGPMGEGDQARTDRLKEIIEEHGWPTFSLVGEDGEDAAWAIAQHSDLDPEFQQLALGYLEDAVAADQASPGNLAYLSDRIAVAKGEAQKYGTQVGCSTYGPVPATPLDDPAAVAERRADAGLEPMADYLAEMAKICVEALDDR